MDGLQLVIDLAYDIPKSFANVIVTLITFFGTPLGDLLDTFLETYPSLGSITLVTRVVEFITDTIGLGNVSLVGILFGGGLIVFLLVYLIKWIIGIVM